MSETRRLSGNVQQFDRLLAPEAMHALEQDFQGLFAFLAFHPGVDLPVTQYIRQGSLATDSGPEILVLFALDSQPNLPKPVTGNSLSSWIDLDVSLCPAYIMVRSIFIPGYVPPLPGILFFERFTMEIEPLYVSLNQAKDEPELRAMLREIFSWSEFAFRAWRDGFSIDAALAHDPDGRLNYLYWLMIKRLSLDDLQALAFLLGIDYEMLDGANKGAKTLSLLNYVKSRGRLADLVQAGYELRDDMPWKQDLDDKSAVPDSLASLLRPTLEAIGFTVYKAERRVMQPWLADSYRSIVQQNGDLVTGLQIF